MIRTIRRLIATDGGDNKEWIELAMLSSDDKPVSGIINGSIATEVDTGSVFFFDEAAGEWIEQFSFQNAGGGGGGNSGVEADYRGLIYAYIDGTGGFRSDTEKKYYMNAFRCAGGTKYIIFPPPEISHNRFRVAYYYNKSYSDFESYIEAAGESGILIYNADEHSTRDNAPYISQPYVITPAQDGELMIETDTQSTTAPAYLVQALT